MEGASCPEAPWRLSECSDNKHCWWPQDCLHDLSSLRAQNTLLKGNESQAPEQSQKTQPTSGQRPVAEVQAKEGIGSRASSVSRRYSCLGCLVQEAKADTLIHHTNEHRPLRHNRRLSWERV